MHDVKDFASGKGLAKLTSKACYKCGILLPTNAKFCDHCGRAQSQPHKTEPSPPVGSTTFTHDNFVFVGHHSTAFYVRIARNKLRTNGQVVLRARGRLISQAQNVARLLARDVMDLRTFNGTEDLEGLKIPFIQIQARSIRRRGRKPRNQGGSGRLARKVIRRAKRVITGVL